MQIHLYNHSKEEAFTLCEKTLSRLGYSIHYSDNGRGLVSSGKSQGGFSNIIFFDVTISSGNHGIMLSLNSNIFSGQTGTFVADNVSEVLFLEVLHELLAIRPMENPFHLAKEDYAHASRF